MKSEHQIAEALIDLAVPVEALTHLPGNPRRSDIEAIAESFIEFGQLDAIICVRDGDDIVVLSGNHQLKAVRDVLKWTHIAAAVHDHLTQEQAMAFAALDNNWHNVGDIDENLQFELIEAAGESAHTTFDAVGWDDFAIAAMENAAVLDAIQESVDHNNSNSGWNAPVMAPLIDPDAPPRNIPDDATPEEAAVGFEPQVDTNTIVTQGSPSTSRSGSSNAVMQYTLAFDGPEQQTTWYAFLRFIKESSVYEGGTTAEQLIAFIEAHSEV
jgi:hypothetical protein